MKNNRKFWNFKASETESRAELTLYGEISEYSWWGDEVTPKEFKKELDALGDVEQLDIFINSGGGDVFAGESIYNMLNRHKAHKVVHIDGLAASIASIIAMVGDEIIMAENAMIMIHEAWTCASGNKRDLRSMADTLERIDGSLRGVYAARTEQDPDAIAGWMESETWFTAAEAVENGFADSVSENKKIAASVSGENLIMNGQIFDLARYSNKPHFTPYNGANTQPVEEDNSALEKQRKMFNETREKILRTYAKENAE